MMDGKPEPVAVRPVIAPPVLPSEAVLVATRDLGFGAVIGASDVRWQSWPREQVPAGTISRTMQPDGLNNVAGAIVRSNGSAGEPLHADRLVKGNGSGFLAAVLPAGMRAVAIDLLDKEKSSAGGFILPNDRVDVIRTFHPDDAPSALASETILTNIRVLAIGQNVQEQSGERTVIGSTATLELLPEQAEKVILAQRTGQLALSLRAMTDANRADELKPAAQPLTMTIIRSGNASQARVR